jgi:hypothetical protein
MKDYVDLMLLVIALICAFMLSAFIDMILEKDAELRQEIIERHIENGNDDNVIKFLE